MTLDATGLDASGRCAIHGEAGCFDCMVGGANPEFKGARAKRGNYGDQFRKPDLSSAVGGYGEVKRLAEAAAARDEDPLYREHTPRPNDGVSHTTRVRQVAEQSAAQLPPATREWMGLDPDLASEKQRRFITSLFAERDVPPALRDAIDVESLKRWEATKLIDDLMKLPRPASAPRAAAPTTTSAPRTTATMPRVPAGRYAIGPLGETKFYRVRVNEPTEGKWAGRVFIDLDVQASDDFHPIHNYATKLAVFTEIARDPRAAMVRYGHELGVCGHCGRTLTDPESIALGIGPICLAKGGI